MFVWNLLLKVNTMKLYLTAVSPGGSTLELNTDASAVRRKAAELRSQGWSVSLMGDESPEFPEVSRPSDSKSLSSRFRSEIDRGGDIL